MLFDSIIRQNLFGCDHETSLYCYYDADILFWLTIGLLGIVAGLVIWKRYTTRKSKAKSIF
jgi:hypothetical protein